MDASGVVAAAGGPAAACVTRWSDAVPMGTAPPRTRDLPVYRADVKAPRDQQVPQGPKEREGREEPLTQDWRCWEH
ncbi:hypothetical protein NQZ68_002506 [Dissostichus eleginoides]|nr:hypothetical protein NQZ68_002506 [Dissostichus eleginoides]